MKFNLVQKNVFMSVFTILSVSYLVRWWMRYHDIWGLVLAALVGILFVWDLCKTMKAESRQEIDRISKPSQQALRILFGAFTPIAPYGMLIGFALAVLLTRALHLSVWIGITVLCLSIIYQIGLYLAVSKTIKNQSGH